jgi:hypothetical protein
MYRSLNKSASTRFRPPRERQTARPKTPTGKFTPKYLVATHHPDDYDPSIAGDEAMNRPIDALNEEMLPDDLRHRDDPGSLALHHDGPGQQ